MKKMEVVLYKMPIIKGQEPVAEEWLKFLESIPPSAIVEMLNNEKAYYEAYFKNVEDEGLYVYMVFASKSIEASNNTAWNSENALDKQHFDYMNRCVDRERVQVIPGVPQFNTWSV